MTVSADTIDRIVANVLSQLNGSAGGAVTAPQSPSPSQASTSAIAITESVVTADTLGAVPSGSAVSVATKAIVTPAAWDVAKARKLKIQRRASGDVPAAAANAGTAGTSFQKALPPILVVVRSTPVVERIWGDLNTVWKRELLGCPDDAAKLAISAICRGESSNIVILAEQTYRAACLANRNDRVKAAPITDPGDFKTVRKQMRANVWCVDPGQRSYFELKNIFREIQS